MRTIEQKAISVAEILIPGGDNYYATRTPLYKIKGKYWTLSFTNDKPLQHGNGKEVVVSESTIEFIHDELPDIFRKELSNKITEAKEKGDGEVPNSSYWYCAGLHDSAGILNKIINL